MFDKNKLDAFFEEPKSPKTKKLSDTAKHTKIVRMSKLLFPAVAAGIIGLLLIIPGLKDAVNELGFDVTKPRLSELEKLHVENTVFYITNADNKISNFYTSSIDETAPGSKLIKLETPTGTIEGKNNSWINLKSDTGFYNQNTNILELKKKSEVFFSEGMDVKTETFNFDFSKSFGYTNSNVYGSGSFGEFNSQGLEVYTKTKILILKGKSSIKINDGDIKGLK